MKTDQDVHVAVQRALTSAWKESQGDEHKFKKLKHRHRNRSMLFVRHLGLHLDEQYNGKSFLVHRKRQKEKVKTPGETLHDIDVFEVEGKKLLKRNVWQIESELAYTFDQKRRRNKPLLPKLVEDLNKLVCGSAEHSIFITSKEWMDNSRKLKFHDVIERAARNWHKYNNGERAFYISTIPFVSTWPNLRETELKCVLLRFDRQTEQFMYVPSDINREPLLFSPR
ncbi:MAG: hypothetical protein OXH31_09625 [Gammaproteobacteria bacterium]|nr:hypothetical protein [Gammaproteobacteria bacterium]